MKTYRICVLGSGAVGKTALVVAFCLQYFITSYDPTIEDSYRKHAVVDGESLSREHATVIEIMDTAGQEEYLALRARDQWIREGEGFLIVYSTTARATFETVDRFRSQIVRVKDSEDVPMVLVGNKVDKSDEREVSKEEAQVMADRLGCTLIETSAKTRYNLELAYYTLVRMIRDQRDGPGGNLRKKKKQRKTKCLII